MHFFYMNLWNSSFIETQLLHPGNVYAAIRKTDQISQMLLRTVQKPSCLKMRLTYSNIT